MKRMIIPLTIIMLFLSACSNTNGSIYTVQLGTKAEGKSIFRKNTPYMPIDDFTDHRDQQESSIKMLRVGEKVYEAKHIMKREWMYRPDCDVYESEDGIMEISIEENTGGFSIGKKKGVLGDFPEKEVTEESLLQYTKTFITQNIGGINFDRYVHSIISRFHYVGDNSLSGGSREGFYPYDAENEKEYVVGYLIFYKEICNDIETANQVMLIIDNYGNISHINYTNYDVDWSSFIVDEEEVAAAVDSFVDEYVNAGGYEELSYEVRNQKLGWSGEEIYLVVEVEIRYYESTVSDGKYLSSGYEGEGKTVATLVLTQ